MHCRPAFGYNEDNQIATNGVHDFGGNHIPERLACHGAAPSIARLPVTAEADPPIFAGMLDHWHQLVTA